MSGTYEQQHREFMRRTNDTHLNMRETRAALRCGLGDAAHLADAISRDLAREHRGRSGRGQTTKKGLELAAVAKRIGDAIWAARSDVVEPTQEPDKGERAT